MHELSIASSVIDIACHHAAGRQVKRVKLQVGHLRQVVASALSFSFEIVAQGTLAEGATLDIEIIPAVGVCRACGAETRLEMFPLQCGTCGDFDLEIVSGEELIVESLDMDTEALSVER